MTLEKMFFWLRFFYFFIIKLSFLHLIYILQDKVQEKDSGKILFIMVFLIFSKLALIRYLFFLL
jgi:hypothetical protein